MGEPIVQEGFDHEAFTQGYQVISEREAYNRYNDMLDETYGEVRICQTHYTTSGALYRVDQTAYRCGFNDFTSHL